MHCTFEYGTGTKNNQQSSNGQKGHSTGTCCNIYIIYTFNFHLWHMIVTNGNEVLIKNIDVRHKKQPNDPLSVYWRCCRIYMKPAPTIASLSFFIWELILLFAIFCPQFPGIFPIFCDFLLGNSSPCRLTGSKLCILKCYNHQSVPSKRTTIIGKLPWPIERRQNYTNHEGGSDLIEYWKV